MTQAQFIGKLRAIADETHPLQTILEIVLTDFEPNKNKQQIPDSEADNLIASALHMPIKINYANGKHKGHAESIPIGTIKDAWREGDQILARSILWKEEFPEIDKYLKTATAEHEYLGTSWEILYKNSETLDNIEILHGCVFSSTVIVDNPAYGFRTPIRSIAEEKESMEEQEKLEKLVEIESAFYQLLDMVYNAYEKVCAEMERKERVARESGALVMAQDAIAQLTSILSSLEQTSAASAEVTIKLTEALSELETFRAEKAQAEKAQAESELLINRRSILATIGVTYTDDEYIAQHQFILSMNDETFNGFVALAERLPKAKAEIKDKTINLPEPIGDIEDRSIKTIVQAIRDLRGN